MVTALCAALCLTIVALVLQGADVRGTDAALKMTARFSFLLFWPAYSAGAIATLFGPRFAVFRRRARDFGLAFASAHLVHIGLVVWLCYIGAAPSSQTFTFFGIAVLWTYLLALLSIDRLHRAVGRIGWALLSVVGLNYIAFAFAVDFMRFPLRGDATYLLGYLPFVVLAIAGPILRLAAGGLRVYQILRNSASPAH